MIDDEWSAVLVKCLQHSKFPNQKMERNFNAIFPPIVGEKPPESQLTIPKPSLFILVKIERFSGDK
ncbi:hypothetical protein [Nitrospira sp.]|uniref:hypothetical protein n=1 Tax=Nitrospira sp. TaxID=70125 RepID=UPI003FCEB58B